MTKHHTTTGWVLKDIVIMKRLKKKEVLFIGNRVLQIDLTIMETFITKEIDSTKGSASFRLGTLFMLLAPHKLKLAHLHFHL